MRRGILLAGSIAGVVILLVLVLGRLGELMEHAIRPAVGRQEKTLVLDAGHGGEDGGAVSLTGVPESQINLAIVLNMRDILGLYGVDPVLLREADISLHSEGADTLREKKTSDLKNRVAAVEALPDATLISIHQNTYTGSRYQGTHVFYAPTPGSKELAEQIQEAIQIGLQPDNERIVKEIYDTVYLMNHITCPAVLVECGFLTNPEEEARLREPGYQKQLAAVIAGEYLAYGRNLA